MREYRLSEQYSVTLDAAGVGWIQGVGPQQQREHWEVTSIQTTVENAVKESRLYVFLDSVDRMIQGTYSGNLDTSDSKITLAAGQKLYFKYDQGEPFANARITIDGIRFVRG